MDRWRDMDKAEVGAYADEALDVPLPNKNPRRDPHGFMIDVYRPEIDNGDGTFSTERTITFDAAELGMPSEIVTIPTIVQGVPVSPELAKRLFMAGRNPPVQKGFEDFQEADKAARMRSDSIKRARETRLKKEQ